MGPPKIDVVKLGKAGIEALAIHGNKSQGARLRALDAFKTRKIRILVATDIAARGIDVSGVSHVFNFDLPNVSETYVHRIGRTARAGREGIAIAFCDDSEGEYLQDIEKLTQQKIEVVDTHEWHFPEAIPEPRVPGRRGKSNAQRNQRSNPQRDQKNQRRGGSRKPQRAKGENKETNQASSRAGTDRRGNEDKQGEAPKRRRRRRRPKRATPMPNSNS